MKRGTAFFLLMTFCMFIHATEYHVAKKGNDINPGTAEKPFLTIQAAADIALPGDVITVHEGIYREWVKPRRGGTSESSRIIYRSAVNGKAEIRGSEIIKSWEKVQGNVWRVAIPDTFFGKYNPYRDIIHGDWFIPQGRNHHTGEVYLNGKSLWEAALLDDVFNPKLHKNKFDAEDSLFTWYCESNNENTFIYANFQGADPNRELVEINVRKCCFYPEKTEINFITVSGFRMSHAATQWAPPTAEQVGLIGTNWSKGWIIENNVISDSKCSGITLGKYGDEFDNTSEELAEGYVETINRAIARGWNKDLIGSHIIRNNTIFNCEQTGICGSLGAIFSTIENNNIYNIWVKRQFYGHEIAGIKIHASIDMLIKKNRLANCGRGLWLDWMSQGTRVTGNLIYNNTTDDVFMEVNHGPFLIDNNLFLSELSLRDWSEGGAYVHNLFAGNIEVKPQDRLTPYLLPHSTELAGLKKTRCGDNRFFNNIFAGAYPAENDRHTGLKIYGSLSLPSVADGNVYLNNANPMPGERNFLRSESASGLKVIEKEPDVTLLFYLKDEITKIKTRIITGESLGKAVVPEAPFENSDGTAMILNTNYFGRKRTSDKPLTGPFEKPGKGAISMKVW